MRAAGDWAWRALVLAALVALILWLLYQLKLVTVSFLVGMLLTALLHPFVGAVSRLRVPRVLATVIVFVVGLGVLVGVGFFIAGQISSNSAALARQFTAVAKAAQHWLTTGPLHVNAAQVDRLVGQATAALDKNSQQIASGAISGIGTGVELLAGALLALFCTFFLLLDGAHMWRWATRMFPEHTRERVYAGGHVAWHTLSHYVRGTVLIALTDAVLVTVTLLIAQVPLPIPVGVLVFLGAFIPVLGLAVTGAVAVALTLVSHGLIVAIIVLGVLVLAVETEGHVLQPVVMSRAVRVHPLVVLLAVTAGTLVLGIFGAIIAVPVVAVVNNVASQQRGEIPGLDRHLPDHGG